MYLSYYYEYSIESNFEEAVSNLLELARRRKNVVRLVFWGNPSDNNMFLVQRSILQYMVENVFGEKIPAYSYVAQPVLLSGTVAMEVQVLEDCEDAIWKYICYKGISYVKVVNNKNVCLLFLPGIFSSDLTASVEEQTNVVMEIVTSILSYENLNISDIVRQWNYIERITDFEPSGKQRYQVFNDVRSYFYGRAFELRGYPAATGIGTSLGGVQIELDAMNNSSFYTSRIDNPNQRAAYEYSSNVLVGDYEKTTPKFERARCVTLSSGGWIYISGTAAIRGEQTLKFNVVEQAKITLENIQKLLEAETLKEYNIKGIPLLKSIRVYVKHAEDVPLIKHCIDSLFSNVAVIYVQADVCREELLVEMEAEAWLLH